MAISGGTSSTGDECADMAETNYEESNGLEEEVDEVMVLPEGHIVTSTEEEESSCAELQQM